MSGTTVLYTLVGIGILTLVLYDVFTTVLHHWGGAGPLSGRLAKWGWSLAVRLTRGLEDARRRRFLGKVGPLLVPATVVLWAGLLVLGFAFLYLPWIPGSFHADSAVPSLRSFGDAVYYSGVTFFTVGYGDIVPVGVGPRLIAMLEGGSGFALITLVISYFTSVYTAYSNQKVAAESLYYQAGLRADAARIIAQHLAGGGPVATLASEVGRIRDGLATVRSDYANYPLLHYFISSRAEQSLIRLLFVAQDLALLLDTAVDPDRCVGIAELGTRSGLVHAAAAVQDGVAETLVRGGLDSVDRGDFAPEDREAWQARFDSARAVLRESGVPVREDPAAAAEYVRRRGEWEPVLRESARRLGEPWGDVSGDY